MSDFTYYRGRVGLYAMLKALRIGPGDNVAIQAFSCVAVPEGIMATGATPTYVDIEEGGVNMSPADLRRKITSSTKAVVLQHTFGVPAALDELLKIAHLQGLPVIEDCCHTHMSSYAGKTVGGFGLGAFYSYEWGKPTVFGVGGSVRVNDLALQSRLQDGYGDFAAPPAANALKIAVQRFIFDTLLTPRTYWYMKYGFRKMAGLGLAVGNYNPVGRGNISPEFGWRMLGAVERQYRNGFSVRQQVFAEHSRRVCAEYQRLIISSRVRKVSVPDGAVPVYARYPLLVADKEELVARARAARLEVAEWYATPIHPLLAAKWHLVHYEAGACPVAERQSGQIISLPTYRRTSLAHARCLSELVNT